MIHSPENLMRQRRQPNKTQHDLFLDFPSTKTYLAELLGVSRSTINLWENIAFWRIQAFRDSYPKKSTGEYDRECPLTPYQCWAICRIGRLMSQIVTAERVKQGIAKNPNHFSLYSFKKSQQQLTKLGA